jgi:hypothetical protein
VDDPSERLEDHESTCGDSTRCCGAGSHVDAASLDGRVAFRTMATDRLPIVEVLPAMNEAPEDTEGFTVASRWVQGA